MDIERLEDLRKRLEYNSELEDEEIENLWELIDEAIARQSATSEEVAEAISHIQGGYGDIWQWPKKRRDTIITALQAYQPWIPVSERLPGRGDADKGGYVLTRFSDRAIESWKWDEIASWNEDNNRSICKLAAITHWRPMLPEPPKGE